MNKIIEQTAHYIRVRCDSEINLQLAETLYCECGVKMVSQGFKEHLSGYEVIFFKTNIFSEERLSHVLGLKL